MSTERNNTSGFDDLSQPEEELSKFVIAFIDGQTRTVSESTFMRAQVAAAAWRATEGASGYRELTVDASQCVTLRRNQLEAEQVMPAVVLTAQPEAKPTGWMRWHRESSDYDYAEFTVNAPTGADGWIPLYAAPPEPVGRAVGAAMVDDKTGEEITWNGFEWEETGRNLGRAQCAPLTNESGKGEGVGCTRSHPHEDMNAECQQKTMEARAANASAQQAEQLPVELRAVAETVAEGGGFWTPCTGCYDTEDGRPTRNYAHSDVLGCALGDGCSECGGLGAVWDDTDYAAMAEFMEEQDAAPQPSEAVAEVFQGYRGLIIEEFEGAALKPGDKLYAAPQLGAKALTDAQIIALADRGEYLTPSPSKYPEAGHGTQYHCGAPGLLGFARALLAASPDDQVAPWISVDARLPAAAGEYLAYRPGAHHLPAADPNTCIRSYTPGKNPPGDRWGGAHRVSHWMPLPAKPGASVAKGEGKR